MMQISVDERSFRLTADPKHRYRKANIPATYLLSGSLRQVGLGSVLQQW
jgi:hypothetical protein